MLVNTFCDMHRACRGGREWAMSMAQTMDELWPLDIDPEWRFWIVSRPGVMDACDLRRLCCKIVQETVFNQLSPIGQKAVLVAADYYVGKASASDRDLAYFAAIEDAKGKNTAAVCIPMWVCSPATLRQADIDTVYMAVNMARQSVFANGGTVCDADEAEESTWGVVGNLCKEVQVKL